MIIKSWLPPSKNLITWWKAKINCQFMISRWFLSSMNVIARSLAKPKKTWSVNSKSFISLALQEHRFFQKMRWAQKQPPAFLGVNCTRMWLPMPFVMKKSSSSKSITTMCVHSLKPSKEKKTLISSPLPKISRLCNTQNASNKSPNIS